MILFDRLTEGEQERSLLQRLRDGTVTPGNLKDEVLPFFVKIQIQTMSHCNARCLPCPYPSVRTELPQGRMSEGVFSILVRQLRDRGVERIGLFLMNEPLLDPRLERFIAMLKETTPESTVLIFTNGRLLTPERALSLGHAGIDEINVSIMGLGREKNERFMTGIYYDRVMENLLRVGRFMKEGKLGAAQVRVVGLSPPGSPEDARLLREKTGLDVFLKPMTNRAGLVQTDSPAEGTDRTQTPRVCQRPFVKAYVLFNGDMILCNCDWKRTTVIGNVTKTPMQELWMSPRLMEIRRSHLKGPFPKELPCEKCDYPYLV